MAKVLVVDDNEIDRLALVRILEGLGHEAMEADDGATAMDVLNHNRADIVLLDINMADMDGLEMLTLVRRAWTADELPIVMVTGTENRKVLGEALKGGANDFIMKPISPVTVQTRLGLHLKLIELQKR